MLRITFLSILLTLIHLNNGLDNGLARTPPMGWMTWERFRCNTDCDKDPRNCISEDLILVQAFKMKSMGFLKAGYQYLAIDDCWLNKTRDRNGYLIPDPVRFPNGMKYIGDMLHNMGLKFGLYEDYGTKTCGGYPGVLNNMQRDVKTFVDWGVDYIKLDGCYSQTVNQPNGYAQYGKYLNASKRPIVYSCSWPAYFNVKNINKTLSDLLIKTCNLWRLYGDIQDSWSSVLNIINYYKSNANNFSSWAGPGHWNDPDMLILGDKSLNYDQQRTQMGMWAIFAAPLFMSNDLRNISSDTVKLLQNKYILAINQDSLGQQGRFLFQNGSVQVWKRNLSKNQAVIALFNQGNQNTVFEFRLSQVGLSSTKGYNITDAFTHSNYMHVESIAPIRATINPFGIEMVFVTL